MTNKVKNMSEKKKHLHDQILKKISILKKNYLQDFIYVKIIR